MRNPLGNGANSSREIILGIFLKKLPRAIYFSDRKDDNSSRWDERNKLKGNEMKEIQLIKRGFKFVRNEISSAKANHAAAQIKAKGQTFVIVPTVNGFAIYAK